MKNKKSHERTPYFHLRKGAAFLLASSIRFSRSGAVNVMCYTLLYVKSIDLLNDLKLNK